MAKDYANLAEALKLLREGWTLEHHYGLAIQAFLRSPDTSVPVRSVRRSTFTALRNRGLTRVSGDFRHTVYTLAKEAK